MYSDPSGEVYLGEKVREETDGTPIQPGKDAIYFVDLTGAGPNTKLFRGGDGMNSSSYGGKYQREVQGLTEIGSGIRELRGGYSSGVESSASTWVEDWGNVLANLDEVPSALLHVVTHPHEVVKSVADGIWDYYQRLKSADTRTVGVVAGELTFAAVDALATRGAGKAGKVVKGATKSKVWTVGPYNILKGTEVGLDAHHVGQKAVMKKFIPGYDMDTAPTILVPYVGHRKKGPRGIVSTKTKGFTNARQILARDIFELRRVYGPEGIPNSALQELIDMNKQMYPSSFTK